LQQCGRRKERRSRGIIPAREIIGELTDDAIGDALKIEMNIKRSANDGVKQDDGDEKGKVLSRLQQHDGSAFNRRVQQMCPSFPARYLRMTVGACGK